MIQSKGVFSKVLSLIILSLVLVSITMAQQTDLKPNRRLLKTIDESLSQSARQYEFMMTQLPADKFPKSFDEGKLLTSGIHAWTSGFYPGTLLYLYESSQNEALKQEAFNKLKLQEKLQFVTTTHDLGFMMFCSFGNAERIASRPEYKEILLKSAKALSNRFNPIVGCIKSWNSKSQKDFTVIIDNMMNLELLSWASKTS